MVQKGPPDAFLRHHEKIKIIAGPARRNPEPARIDKIRTFLKNRNLPASVPPCGDNADRKGSLAQPSPRG
jgi:hypothetical protein